jgi:hypothetical protein
MRLVGGFDILYGKVRPLLHARLFAGAPAEPRADQNAGVFLWIMGLGAKPTTSSGCGGDWVRGILALKAPDHV